MRTQYRDAACASPHPDTVPGRFPGKPAGPEGPLAGRRGRTVRERRVLRGKRAAQRSSPRIIEEHEAWSSC